MVNRTSYYKAVISVDEVREIFFLQIREAFTKYDFYHDRENIYVTCKTEIKKLGRILKELCRSHKIKSVDYSYTYQSVRKLKIPNLPDGTVINGKVLNNPGVEAKLKKQGKRRIPKQIRYKSVLDKPLIKIGDD